MDTPRAIRMRFVLGGMMLVAVALPTGGLWPALSGLVLIGTGLRPPTASRRAATGEASGVLR